LEEKKSNSSKTLITGLILGLILGVVVGYLYSISSNDDPGAGDQFTKDQIITISEAYINQNLLKSGVTAKVQSVTEKSGLYFLDVKLSSGLETQILESYVTKDGKLFITETIDMTKPVSRSTETTQPPKETKIDMQGLIEDDPWGGKEDGKVIIVEFSDFLCPFCKKSVPVVKRVLEIYGDQVLFVYRDFPIYSLHPTAGKAAEAAECADDQGRFWEYHDNLFDKQSEWGKVGVPKFKEYAIALELDTNAFNECLDSGKYTDEVNMDLLEGKSLGITGTPAFFINGRKVAGSQPFSVFKEIIDEELNKA
jgi:protein-disulfide isomerase